MVNIPSDIVDLCVLFLFMHEEIFDVINKENKLSENKKAIENTGENRSETNNNYGINEIDSMNNCSYRWKLKVKGEVEGIGMGIASNQIPDQAIEHDRSGIYYVCFNGCIIKYPQTDGVTIESHDYDKEFETNDIISLNLDLNAAQMKVQRNGKQMFLFEKIKKSPDIKYRLVVSLYLVGGCVEIIDFTTK